MQRTPHGQYRGSFATGTIADPKFECSNLVTFPVCSKILIRAQILFFLITEQKFGENHWCHLYLHVTQNNNGPGKNERRVKYLKGSSALINTVMRRAKVQTPTPLCLCWLKAQNDWQWSQGLPFMWMVTGARETLVWLTVYGVRQQTLHCPHHTKLVRPNFFSTVRCNYWHKESHLWMLLLGWHQKQFDFVMIWTFATSIQIWTQLLKCFWCISSK